MPSIVNFNYKIYGDCAHKERLVFLHGLMGHQLNWRHIALQLQDQFRILLYDQRGHGKSFQPEMGYSVGDYASDLHFMSKELGWSQFYLVGHSMGARNALYFTSQFPELVKKLVMVDMGVEPIDHSKKIFMLVEALPKTFKSKRSGKEFLLNDFVVQNRQLRNVERLAQYFYSNLVERQDQTASWQFSVSAILATLQQSQELLLWEHWKNLSVPTLLIRGSLSEEFPPQLYFRMLRSNSQAVGRVIENAGHWVHADQPQKFIESLRAFF